MGAHMSGGGGKDGEDGQGGWNQTVEWTVSFLRVGAMYVLFSTYPDPNSVPGTHWMNSDKSPNSSVTQFLLRNSG